MILKQEFVDDGGTTVFVAVPAVVIVVTPMSFVQVEVVLCVTSGPSELLVIVDVVVVTPDDVVSGTVNVTVDLPVAICLHAYDNLVASHPAATAGVAIARLSTGAEAALGSARSRLKFCDGKLATWSLAVTVTVAAAAVLVARVS